MINRCIVSVCYACLTVVGMLYSEMPESFQVIVYQSLDKRIYSNFLWGVFLRERSVSWVVCASFIASDLHYCSKTGHLRNFQIMSTSIGQYQLFLYRESAKSL